MSTMAMIVSIITVIGSLILVTNNSQFRNLGASRMIRLALVWAAIIFGLVLVIQFTGIQIQR